MKTPVPAALAALLLTVIAVPPAAAQQATSSGASRFQSGYGDARSAVATPATGSTRDANGNRLIVNGIIQAGASSYSSSSGGVARSYSGAGGTQSGTQVGGSTAIGNQLNVVVTGNRNTVIVNSNQTNSGDVSAGTVLNGTLNLP
ncbi:holdfast anchoring protein HfaA [Brevundimonas balnearis]|uniref:Holdfast anchoring protein HfaA n=1 Tax=Brevundimonas balnearis TaxID=1572858 RepID=A0ABV6R1M3_9CAUL